MLLTATAHVFKLQESRFISTHKYSCVTAWQWTLAYAGFGGITVGILAESHREAMGSHRIPSGLTEIPQNPEFLSRWDHGKSRRDSGGIPTGSRRDIAGIPSGSRKIPSFYPAGIPVNPDGIPVNPDGIPVNPDGIPTISRSNPTKSRQNPVGIWAGSHRDLGGIPPGSQSGSRVFIPVDPSGIPIGIPVGSHRDSHPFFHLGIQQILIPIHRAS